MLLLCDIFHVLAGVYIEGAVQYLFFDAEFLLLSNTLARRIQAADSVAHHLILLPKNILSNSSTTVIYEVDH